MNLAMLLDMAASGFGERPLVGAGEDRITFEEMRYLASGAAGEAPRGGSAILALAGPNHPAVPAALFSAAWAGLSYAPLNYRLAPESLATLLGELDAATVLCPKSVAAALVGRDGVERLADIGSWLSQRRSAATGPAAQPYPEEPGHPAVLLYTSGTSARPKAAVLQHDHLVSYVLNTTEFGCAGEDEAVILAAPPFHVAGVVGVLTACYAGRRIVPLPRFSAEEWLRAARVEGATHGFVVPTMLARVVALMEADAEARLPALRTLTYGGARMPLAVLERALELMPETGFVNAYGLTETSSTVCLLGPDDHREAAASTDSAIRRRLESAGTPIPGVEVAIRDAAGAKCQPGEVGEIVVRGSQVAGDYVNHDTRRGPDGWLRTGDLGWLDDQGYLFVTGRADEMIIRGGENISPTEVEDALMRHPSVEAAAVVGLPDTEWGESVAAMVSARSGASVSDQELRGWVAERLGTLKAPDMLVVVDELPLTDTGKVLRRKVRDQMLEQES